MCGINGIIGAKGSSRQLSAMQIATIHRGPDAQGIYCKEEEECYLGHNRLSIIDLSKKADQPMYSKDGHLVILFNGEVYNYKEIKKTLEPFFDFKTNSDTEVVLAAYIYWGKKCLERFIGMFSFVVWDTKKKKLFAARDRFGVKPFFYSIVNDTFVFSSEIKGIWASNLVEKKPNASIWMTYWTKSLYDHSNYSFWEDILKLGPGCYLEYSKKDGLRINNWYDLAEKWADVDDRSEKEIKDELLAILEESIALRFRADVPVGVCLSGGLDSSLLLTLIRRVKGKDYPLHAFTFYTGDSRYDELHWAEQMTQNSSVIHHKCLLKANDIPNLAESLANSMDEPYGGIPTIGMGQVYKKASELGIKVLLDGNGMDEGWGGYDYYTRADQIPYSRGPVQGARFSETLESVLLPNTISCIDISPPQLFKQKHKSLQYRDIMQTKIPRGMRFADRNSMAHSIELREPFLDHRLIELGGRQRKEMLINGKEGKYIVRQLARDILPNGLALVPKRALQTPQREWLAEDLSFWVSNILNNSDQQLWNWFDQKKVWEMWGNYRTERPDNSFYIWQLIDSAIHLS